MAPSIRPLMTLRCSRNMAPRCSPETRQVLLEERRLARRQAAYDDVRFLRRQELVVEGGGRIAALEAHGLEACERSAVSGTSFEDRLEALFGLVEMALREIELPKGGARRPRSFGDR